MNNKKVETEEEPKLVILNDFSTAYSLTNGGNQDQGPFITNSTVSNLYNILPYGIIGELLVRNKSKKGNFTDNLQVDGGDVIEFKLSITNTSTTKTLYKIEAIVNISDIFLSSLNIPAISSIGTTDYRNNYLALTIDNLLPGVTSVATYEFRAVYNGELSFSGYINVTENMYIQTRQFNFSKFPSLSIGNAVSRSNSEQRIIIGKSQRLIQTNLINRPSTNLMNVVNGDIIEFSLYVNNNNTTNNNNPTLFNLNMIDKLNNNLRYIPNSFTGIHSIRTKNNFIDVNEILGNPIFNSKDSANINGKLIGGSIEWNISSLIYANDLTANGPYAATLSFQCEVIG